MNTGIRIILCAALACVAVTLAGFTLAGFRGEPPEQNSPYLLGVSDGNVAVYGREDPKNPVAVTDIRLSSLRERDRALISDGLPVASSEELARLLEDLGA